LIKTQTNTLVNIGSTSYHVAKIIICVIEPARIFSKSLTSNIAVRLVGVVLSVFEFLLLVVARMCLRL
ncbi:MAG: hypothetical protein QXU21_04080, partial [Candidatus Bathyarchaeia archaeon]